MKSILIGLIAVYCIWESRSFYRMCLKPRFRLKRGIALYSIDMIILIVSAYLILGE